METWDCWWGCATVWPWWEIGWRFPGKFNNLVTHRPTLRYQPETHKQMFKQTPGQTHDGQQVGTTDSGTNTWPAGDGIVLGLNRA